jgi:hypothetical protein
MISAHRHRFRKILATAAVAVAIAVVAAVGFVGWYYSGVLRNEALNVDHSPAQSDLIVEAVADNSITLDVTMDSDLAYGAWRTPGLWGLEGPEGWYGTVRDIVSQSSQHVVRVFSPLRGKPVLIGVE